MTARYVPLLVVLVSLSCLASAARATTNQDFDDDGALNLADNCKYRSNATQDDPAGLATGPDGVGTACQCGDVDDDGDIDLRDLAVLQRDVDPSGPLSPGVTDAQKCSVAGGPDDCDSADLSTLRDAVAEKVPVVNLCRAFVGTVSVPVGLSAVAGSNRVLLDWEAVPSSLVTGYHVYRSDTSGSGYVALTSGGATEFTSYEDSTVLNGSAYFYVVTAVAGGEGDASIEVSAMPQVDSGGTLVTSDISTTTTWTLLGSPYTVEKQLDGTPTSVIGGAMLTIEAGVDVRFEQDVEFEISSSSANGGIQALGSEVAHITMRGTSGVAGHWVGVDLQVGLDSSSILDHVLISDAGNGKAGLSLNSVSSDVQISHVDVTNVANEAIYLSGGSPIVYASGSLSPGGGAFGVTAPDAASGFSLIGSTVRGGVSVAADHPGITFAANTYADYDVGNPHRLPAVLGGAIVAGGEFLGIPETSKVVLTDGTIDRSVRWPAYRYEATQHIEVSGAGAPVLSLDPGVEVLVGPALRIDIAGPAPGGIRALGTASERIVFRASAGTPNPGHWRGLRLDTGVTADSALDYVEIYDTGDNGVAALRLVDVPGSVQLTNGIIDHTTDVGIEIAGGAPVLDSWTIAPGSTSYAITADAPSNPSLSNITAEGGMEIAGTAVSIPTTITLTDYANGPPLRIPPDLVAWVNVLIQIQGDDENSVVEVSGGSVSSSAIWQPYRYVLLGDLTVEGSSAPMLILSSGTDLFVANGKKFQIGSQSLPGGIQAIGTPERIEFFADTGSWTFNLRGSILESSVLDQVTIDGLGPPMSVHSVPAAVQLTNLTVTSTVGDAVKIDGGSPVLDNWTITPGGTDQRGIHVATPAPDLRVLNSTIRGAISFDADDTATISGNEFADYGVAPYANSWLELPPTLVAPVIADNVFLPSQTGTIRLANGTMTQSGTWPADFVYEFPSDEATRVSIAGGLNPTLTIEAGTELRFGSSSAPGIEVGNGGKGGLIVNGTAESHVLFLPAQSNASWGGLKFWGGTLNTSLIEHAEIDMARIGVWVDESAPAIRDSLITNPTLEGVFIFRGSPTIENNNISGSAGAFGILCSSSPGRPVIRANELTANALGGIKITGGCDPRIEQNTIVGAPTGIQIQTASPGLVVRSNEVTGSTVTGLENQDAASGVDARLNFWGSGVDPATQVSGSGVVLTNPWLEAKFVGPFETLSGSALPETFAPPSAQSRLRATFSESASWTLTIPSGQPIPQTTMGFGALDVTWDGGDCGDPPVACGNGIYEYTLQAEPSGGGTASPTIRGQVTLDAGLPTARIDAPDHLETHLGAPALPISGEVSGHTSYRFDYGVGPEPSSFFAPPIATGDSGTTNPSHTWNTSALTEGVYTLRLVATNTTPNPDVAAEDRITVKILALKDPVTATPNFFSPNVPPDGVQDVVTVKTRVSLDADWVIDLFDPSEQIAHQLPGSGAVVDEVWAGAPGTEQVYSVCVRPNAGGVELVQAIALCPTVTLDTTPPTVAITDPTQGQDFYDYDEIDVTGTATDPHPGSHTLAAEQSGVLPDPIGGGGGDVENVLLGTLASDDPNAPTYANGVLTFRLEATDAAGNSAETTTDVDIDRLFIANVGFSPLVFDPFQTQSSTLTYDLSGDADITVTLYPSGQADEAATLASAEPRAAGLQSEVWTGALGAGGTATNDAYYPVITADDGTRTVTYNDAAALAEIPSTFPGPFSHHWANLTFNGQGFQFPNAPQDVKPEQNAGVRIDYDVDEAGKHRIEVCAPDCQDASPTVEVVRAPVRYSAGPVPPAYWDGRIGGSIYQGDYEFNIDDVRPIEEGIVFAQTPSAQVETLRVNPFIFQPMYGQVANIELVLTQPADVQIDLYDPQDAFQQTLFQSASPVAGYLGSWDGRHLDGTIVETEGFYELRATVTDAVTGEVVNRTAVLQVLY